MKRLSDLLRRSAGVHPPDNKGLTSEQPIRSIEAPEKVVIPLQQHLGAPNVPKVKKGDQVGVGTVLGDADAYVSAPIHSSVSGRVTQVAPQPNPLGKDALSVIIENDGEYRPDPALQPPGDWREMEPDAIRAAIRAAGVVGLGGATFPTHVKLNPPAANAIDTVIINGAECEPYLNADNRLMLEKGEEVLEGLRIIMRTVGAERGIVAVEDNKPEAVDALRRLDREDNIKIVRVRTRYPQGAEKVLIDTLTGKEVPSGGLPMHVGVVVNNVGTAQAVTEYFRTGMPLVKRVVTVTGSVVRNPSNLMVPLGTSFAAAVEACGGFIAQPGKVIMGGPMMGLAQYALEVPVIKATSGILALSREEVSYRIPSEPVCIRCGRCVKVCPMGLIPTYLATYAHFGKIPEMERLNVNDCIECGCCAYICPTRNPMVQLIKLGKAETARSKERKLVLKAEAEEAAPAETEAGTEAENGGDGDGA